jgi:glycosyltransferase involved in cell wall biosynthesis
LAAGESLVNHLISVVIPAYNAAAFLDRAVQSVNAQTFRDIETIIVDDGSGDETPAAAERLSNCRYFRIAHSGLPAVPRNFGVKQAQGEYIAFLDADDEWVPGKLQVQSQILEANSGIGLVCSNAFVMRDDHRDTGELYLKPGQGKTGKVLKQLAKDNFIITSTVLMRKDLFHSSGGFSEEPQLCALEDYDLWLRVAGVADIRYVEEPLAFYRDSPSSLSRVTRDQTVAQSIAMAKCAECDVHLNAHEYSELVAAWLRFLEKQPLRALKYMAVKLSGSR